MNKPTITAALLIVVVIAIAGAALWYFITPYPPSSAPAEPLTIGTLPDVSSSLIYIANDRHFFTGNGLSVTIKDYDSGMAAIRAMDNGEIDIAGTAEYPVVRSVFGGEKIKVLGTISKFEDQKLIVRRDRGIVNASDLRGRKIGVPRGTIAEFYLGRFLTLHGVGMQEVTIIDVSPEAAADTMANGSLDAVLIWEPIAGSIEREMGSNVTAWPAQSSQAGYWTIVSTDDWISAHPERATGFLRAIDEADTFATGHPAEARAIVQKRLNLSNTYMNNAWQQNRFGLSLDQSLVLAMEDEARWMRANNLTNATAMPDFGKYVYPDALATVNPGSVNIIR